MGGKGILSTKAAYRDGRIDTMYRINRGTEPRNNRRNREIKINRKMERNKKEGSARGNMKIKAQVRRKEANGV